MINIKHFRHLGRDANLRNIFHADFLVRPRVTYVMAVVFLGEKSRGVMWAAAGLCAVGNALVAFEDAGVHHKENKHKDDHVHQLAFTKRLYGPVGDAMTFL